MQGTGFAGLTMHEDDVWHLKDTDGYNNHAEWILDSGCSHHLVTSPRFLNEPRKSSLKIRMANDQVVDAALVGTVKLDLRNGKTLTLKEAHYVPNLGMNLISIARLTNNGLSVKFSGDKCIIAHGKREVTESNKHGALWPLKCTPTYYADATAFLSCIPSGSLQEWHERLGHLNKTSVVALAKDRLPEEMTITRSENDLKIPCIACAVGKQSRSKQPTNDTSSSAPTEEIGSVISSDVVGKIVPTDRYGNRYYVNYIDHGSGYVQTYPLKKKSEQGNAAINFITEFERSFGTTVKVFRSDRGGEYTSTRFKDFLKSKGIVHQLTERDTSASNGKAERSHRTLMNGTRTMLFGSDVSSKFWSHALRYTTYLRNRSPSRSIAENKSPLEILTGKTPSVNHVVAFGSTCTVHVQPSAKGIFRRAEVGRILGVNPDTNAYDVWVPRTSKVITSKDVVNIGKAIGKDASIEEAPRFAPSEEFDMDVNLRANAIQTNNARESSPHARNEQEPRRSDRVLFQRMALIGAALAVHQVREPTTAREALSSAEASQWENAMLDEIKNLEANGTWTLVDKPANVNIVTTKWVFKTKYTSTGEIERFKARLVARGFTQRFGHDYDETFAPVIKQQSVKLLFVVAATLKVELIHMDVPQAYVKALIDKVIYVEVPALVEGDSKTQVLQL